MAQHLAASGHSVGILDRALPHGSSIAIDHPERHHIYDMDCRNAPGKVDPREWDFVYHLASTVGVNRVLASPHSCVDNIVNSTGAILQLGLPGMYFSTSEVYGKNFHLLKEDSECILSGKARWSYAAAKLCGEWMALQAGWKVVRLFNVIGPNQNLDYGAVVPRFIDAAQEGKAIPVYGSGEQLRTFTSVHDVVQILDILREKKFDVVNVGSKNTISIAKLAQLIKKLTGSISTIEYIPYRLAYSVGFEECPERVPNLDKLRSLIGDYKFRSLEEALGQIIKAQEKPKWEDNLQTTAQHQILSQ